MKIPLIEFIRKEEAIDISLRTKEIIEELLTFRINL
jgi:hypothetical protein